MRLAPVLMLLFSSLLAYSLPSAAKVLATGPVSKGYYWQLVETGSGIRYYCRSVSGGKYEPHSRCKAAGARKP